VVLARRQLLQGLGAASALTALPGWAQVGAAGKPAALPGARSAVAGALTMDKLTPHKDATGYNNFYEFGTDKSDPAAHAGTLKTRPWTSSSRAKSANPAPGTSNRCSKLGAMEERVYRLRCVEGWSMVIPWWAIRSPNSSRGSNPTGNAKFVQFVTLADREQMPGLRSPVLDWPYVEGLRLDEAMHPLTMLAFGMYGEVCRTRMAPAASGRAVEYGFKSGKSIVRIRFVDKQPQTNWERAASNEYGFYSNVNPTVDHPRWSQATERRIGEDGLFAKKRRR